MLHLKNLETYTPENVPEELAPFGVMFFRSEDGKDFYEVIKECDPDTMKILYANGVVTGFSEDASSLYPEGSSLIEVPADSVPEDLALDGKYLFDPEKLEFTKNPAYDKRELEIRKQSAMAIANEKIAQYQDKVDIGEANKTETTALKNWKAYRIKVREAQDVGSLPKQPRL